MYVLPLNTKKMQPFSWSLRSFFFITSSSNGIIMKTLKNVGRVASLVLFLSAAFSPAFGDNCPGEPSCVANCCSDQWYDEDKWDCNGNGNNCVNQFSMNCGCSEDPGLAGPG
jgi:hypothetical protein